MSVFEYTPGEYTGPVPDQLDEEQIAKRFEREVELHTRISSMLTEKRRSDIVDKEDVDIDSYRLVGITSDNPLDNMFSLWFDVLKQRKFDYDIIFVRSNVGHSNAEVMVNSEQYEACRSLRENLSPRDNEGLLRPTQHLINKAFGEASLTSPQSELEIGRCVDEELIARCGLTAFVAKESRRRLVGSSADTMTVPTGYADIIRQDPQIRTLGPEELAGMISRLTHEFLEENPQHKLSEPDS